MDVTDNPAFASRFISKTKISHEVIKTQSKHLLLLHAVSEKYTGTKISSFNLEEGSIFHRLLQCDKPDYGFHTPRSYRVVHVTLRISNGPSGTIAQRAS